MAQCNTLLDLKLFTFLAFDFVIFGTKKINDILKGHVSFAEIKRLELMTQYVMTLFLLHHWERGKKCVHCSALHRDPFYYCAFLSRDPFFIRDEFFMTKSSKYYY